MKFTVQLKITFQFSLILIELKMIFYGIIHTIDTFFAFFNTDWMTNMNRDKSLSYLGYLYYLES